MAKFALVLAAVWLTGCARAHLTDLSAHHPAASRRPQAPVAERRRRWRPYDGRSGRKVAVAEQVQTKSHGHGHHGH